MKKRDIEKMVIENETIDIQISNLKAKLDNQILLEIKILEERKNRNRLLIKEFLENNNLLEITLKKFHIFLKNVIPQPYLRLNIKRIN